MKTRFFHLAILLFFLGCTKEEITPREYPRVSTIETVDVTSEEVTFKGEIVFSSVDIKDHGFVWSDVLGPLVSTANKISLGTKSDIGQFEAKCDRGLEDGKKYYMRAYAISEDFVVYGNTIEFISLGSKAPVFKDFFPTTGTWSDSVTIVGENFSDQNRINIVKFGQNTATVIRSTKDTLLAIVPGDLATKLSKVSVTVAGNSSSSAKEFELTSPTITSVTPGIGLPGTKVTINGEHLLGVATKIYFGDTQASVLSWSSKKIECLVPDRPNGEVLLKVETGTGGLSATAPFKVQPEHLPELYEVQPAVASYAETVKLVGNHFATEAGKNIVMFGNTPTYIVSESKTEIEVAVPDAETRTPTITVTSYGSSVSISTFTMKSPVINDFSPHRGMPTDELIVTGSYFRGSYLKVFLDDVQLHVGNMDDTHLYTSVPYELTKHEGTLKVMFYDQEFVLSQTFKSPWIRINDFPGTGLTSSHTFVHNNAAYVALVGNGTNNEVWKFSDNQWSQLNDFPGIDPGSSLGSTFSFIVGTKGYIGGGDIDAMQRSNDLWEYDVVADSWTKQTDIPQPDYVFSGFAVGSTGFAFEKDFVTQPKLWAYNAAADTWSMKSVVPDGMSGTAKSFVIGNTAYLLDDQWHAFWRYVPSSNQWTAVSVPAHFKFAFSIGGFGYAGNRYSFYKFNPATDEWVQELMPYPYIDDDNNFISFSINGKGYIVRRSSGTYDKIAYEYDPSF